MLKRVNADCARAGKNGPAQKPIRCHMHKDRKPYVPLLSHSNEGLTRGTDSSNPRHDNHLANMWGATTHETQYVCECFCVFAYVHVCVVARARECRMQNEECIMQKAERRTQNAEC